MNIKITCEANEKFKSFQEEVCDFLFEMLQECNILEKEIYERDRELKAKSIEAGNPEWLVPEGWHELMDEFKERFFKIIDGKCTEKLMKRGYARSFGDPQEFGYLNEECRAVFIMKSAQKAVVEIHYSQGVECKHKFVLKKMEDKWLLDEFYYGFEDEDHWYIHNL